MANIDHFSDSLPVSLLNRRGLDVNKIITKQDVSFFLSELGKKKHFAMHPFFGKINDYSSHDVALVLSPFFFAVHYWLDNLLMFYIDLLNKNDDKSAKLVGENMADESGVENGSINFQNSHKVTYIRFLEALGNNNKRPIITSAVIKFNKELENSLYTGNHKSHACLLGAIEYFYIGISTIIKDYCNTKNIEQSHYTVHEILDSKHSMDFFNIAINCGATVSDFCTGINKGFQMLWNIYENMLAEYKLL